MIQSLTRERGSIVEGIFQAVLTFRAGSLSDCESNVSLLRLLSGLSKKRALETARMACLKHDQRISVFVKASLSSLYRRLWSTLCEVEVCRIILSTIVSLRSIWMRPRVALCARNTSLHANSNIVFLYSQCSIFHSLLTVERR